MKKLLIRADDLGYTKGINSGIAKAANDGLVRNIGIMINMPYVSHGLSLLQKKEELNLGLHVNLSNGYPISNVARIPSLVDGKKFKSSSVYRQKDHDFVIVDEAMTEVEKQVERFIDIVGRQPDYIDFHAVSSEHANRAIKIVSEILNLKFSEVSFDPKHAILVGKTLTYIVLDCNNLDYDPFKTIEKTVATLPEDKVAILPFHPGYIDSELLSVSSLTTAREKDLSMLCGKKVKQWLDKNDVTLLNYRDL